MTVIKFLVGLVAFVALLAVPIWIARWIIGIHRDGFSGDMAGGVGGALQELDRLVGRPSTEHKIAAENQLHAPDEESGEAP